ncbi:MAG: chitinase N-terminal domain-containing protein, partial [Thiohalocapsa sp.]
SLPATAFPAQHAGARHHRRHYQVDFRNGGLVVAPLTTDPRRLPDWQWGLRLVGYGTPERPERVANARIEVCADRLEYRRGAITEWYEMKPSGLEQGFTLHRAPVPGAIDVILHLAIDGDLRGEWAMPGQAVGFRTASGELALSYGDLKAIDANGQLVPARLILGPRHLAIQVQVRDAAWPIVVDPLIAEPGEPVLDWLETEHWMSDSANSVQVPISWNRFYGEPALTAQYWLNDELVLTRAVEDGNTQFGSATLTIAQPGEYSLTVSLCDTDGCSESEPVSLSVFDDGDGLAFVDSGATESAAILTFEEAQRIVNETRARLANDALAGDFAAVAMDQTWGAWFAGFVGKAALKYGLTMGFEALLGEIGLRADGPDLAAQLAGIDQSLGEIRTQLDDISRKIDVGKADTDFKNSHRLADVAVQNIKTIAGNIAAAEAGTSAPTQFQLESWAKDNRNNIGALRSLLTNSLTGAVPLMLDYYQVKYPVSTGIEIRTEVDGYLNGFRAALGIGLLNQAWLSDAFAPNALYDEGADSDARATVVSAYNMTGAPYPQPSISQPRFIHRIGTAWALIDSSQRYIRGYYAPRVKTQNRSEVWSIYGTIGAGVNAPGGRTIDDYMDDIGVKRIFQDPNSVRIDERDSVFECEIWVRYDRLYIAGNTRASDSPTAYNRKFSCAFGGRGPRSEARTKQYELSTSFSSTQWVDTRSVPTNAWGMPALTDADSIRGYRDGIDVTSLTRGDGNAIKLAINIPHRLEDKYMQLHDPETGALLTTTMDVPKSGNSWTLPNVPAPNGAVEVRLGNPFGKQSDGEMVVLESTLVTANPGSTSIALTIHQN